MVGAADAGTSAVCVTAMSVTIIVQCVVGMRCRVHFVHQVAVLCGGAADLRPTQPTNQSALLHKIHRMTVMT